MSSRTAGLAQRLTLPIAVQYPLRESSDRASLKAVRIRQHAHTSACERPAAMIAQRDPARLDLQLAAFWRLQAEMRLYRNSIATVA